MIGIAANALVLDGTIKAQGQKTYHDDLPAGAGGSIHVDVGMLTGAGTFSVEGGRNTYNFRDTAPAGAGGRISVFADDVAGFTGVYRTASGVSSRNTVSGAGTTYVKLSTEDYGHLLSENGGRVAGAGSTPVASVGEHLITNVVLESGTTWRVTVEGTPWAADGNVVQKDLRGIQVDLDVTNENNPLYLITGNDGNSLLIESADDPSAYLSGTLGGVHLLQTIDVSAGASVDFGLDVVILADPANSNFSDVIAAQIN
ncbi:hypothetical protein A3709_10325 [Halioglobus sp. HI00S01]|nr:hypothetical protein A3709_10325 [Halioglobus sp. HI00S01]